MSIILLNWLVLQGLQMNRHGYTLIEILIALFIFAILAVIVSIGLSSVLETRDSSQMHVQRLAEIQMAMSVMERDLSQIIVREVLNEAGEVEESLYETAENGNQRIAFTRAGYVNPLSRYNRSTLQRVEYYLEGGDLIRENWESLDRVANSESQTRVLLSRVSELNWKFLDDNLKFHTLWPPVESLAFEIPKGIELEINLEDWGLIKRLIMISKRSET